MSAAIRVTVGILTRNSADVVGDAIRSIADFDEIIVCDGGSSDRTRALASSLGCTVLDQDPACLDSQGRLTDIAGVREQVLRAATHDWVFFLDSDELATPELADEIRGATAGPRQFGAYEIPRLYVLDGEVIRCAMTYPSTQVRLVHRSAINGYHGLVHDVPVMKDGELTGRLHQAQLVPQPPLRDLWRKWSAYMRLEEIKNAHLSRKEWQREVLRPQLRFIRWLSFRYLQTLRSCHGRRLPVRYEVGRIAYELGVVFYTGRRFLGINRLSIDDAWGDS